MSSETSSFYPCSILGRIRCISLALTEITTAPTRLPFAPKASRARRDACLPTCNNQPTGMCRHVSACVSCTACCCLVFLTPVLFVQSLSDAASNEIPPWYMYKIAMAIRASVNPALTLFCGDVGSHFQIHTSTSHAPHRPAPTKCVTQRFFVICRRDQDLPARDGDRVVCIFSPEGLRRKRTEERGAEPELSAAGAQ